MGVEGSSRASKRNQKGTSKEERRRKKVAKACSFFEFLSLLYSQPLSNRKFTATKAKLHYHFQFFSARERQKGAGQKRKRAREWGPLLVFSTSTFSTLSFSPFLILLLLSLRAARPLSRGPGGLLILSSYNCCCCCCCCWWWWWGENPRRETEKKRYKNEERKTSSSSLLITCRCRCCSRPHSLAAPPR